MSARADLVDLLSAKTSILPDFDGPVCSMFANHRAPGVAAKLRDTLADAGVAIPVRVEGERDPLEALKWAATLGQPRPVRRWNRCCVPRKPRRLEPPLRRRSAASSGALGCGHGVVGCSLLPDPAEGVGLHRVQVGGEGWADVGARGSQRGARARIEKGLCWAGRARQDLTLAT